MSRRVTIVIPVYNVENFIKRCISSVLNQTYENYSVVIVDDGSEDNSIFVAKEVCGFDDRFIFVKKKNGGLSSARNFGINYCESEYVCFLDSDDYYEKDFLELMVSSIDRHKADIVICKTKVVSESGNLINIVGHSLSGIVSKGKVLRDNLHQKVSSAAWNKIFRRIIFDNPNCLYPEGMLFEDRAVFHNQVLSCNRVLFIEKPLINYVQRKGSIMNSFSPDKVASRYNVISKVRRDLEAWGVYEDYKYDWYACVFIVFFVGGAKQILLYSRYPNKDMSLILSYKNRFEFSMVRLALKGGVSLRFLVRGLLYMYLPRLSTIVLRYKNAAS